MRFLIVNTETNAVVEEHNEKHLAHGACRVLNAYDWNHDLPPTHIVQPTCPTCHSDEMERVDMIHEDWLCLSCHYVLHLKGK